jgi:hypothetical protein
MPSPFALSPGDAPDIDVLVTQLLIAFGQGTGSLYIHPDVISQARRTYRPIVADALASWSATAIQAHEYARALGRIAGHLAVGEGLDIVLIKHVDAAAAMLRANSGTTACANCPFCD